MNVLLVALGAAPPGDGLVADVAALRRQGATVQLISRLPAAASLAAMLDGTTTLRGGRLPRLSAGRLRVEPDRLPAALRIVLGRRTRALVAAADVLVAVDAAAVPAVWLAARRQRRALAVDGLPAARARLGHPGRS